MNKRQLTLGSLFDGIGGFPYAASFYGIRALWASEIIPECISVTGRHFPDMEHVGDITKLNGGSLPPVDIITFGSPCQDLSIASGRRLGLAGERSGLFLEAVRIIREMQEETNGRYPGYAVWENVPGALSSSGRRDFKAVLEAFAKTEVPMPGSGRWSNAGMVRGRGVDLAWCVYDAQYFGTAQRRRRLFLVADLGGERAGEILFVPKSLSGYFAAGGTPRQGAAAHAQDGAGTAGADGLMPAVSMRVRCGCEGGGKGPLLQIEKSGTLATGNDQYLFAPRGGPGSDGRRAVCMATGQADAEIMEERSPTFAAGHEHPIVAHPQVTGTLCASGAGLSRPAGQGNEPDFCVVSQGNVGMREGPSPVPGDLCVRRLTPTEAERLQGFPDGWTAYGADGRRMSDTKRYQMLGNSVAVPCVAYIMQGISGTAACKEGKGDDPEVKTG